MGLKRISKDDIVNLTNDELLIAIDNGDLKALQEVVEKWGFVNNETALRFALGILFLSKDDKKIRVSKEGKDTSVVPSPALLKDAPPSQQPEAANG